MGKGAYLDEFERWLLASDRLDSTIALRMRHVRDLAAQHPDLMAVTQTDLTDTMAARRRLSPETRKSQLSSWRLFYGWAHKSGHRQDNPTVDIRSIRIPVRVPRVAPDEDIQRAIEQATPEQRAMVMLARYACLRLSELTALHTSAREGRMLRVLGKGNKERMVGVNEELLFALRTLERQQGRGYYFPGLSGPHMHPMSVNKIITRVTGWNPHSLRHAGATAAYRETGDLRAVQAMLGHASLATTQRYLHLDEQSLLRVADATTIRRHDRFAA